MSDDALARWVEEVALHFEAGGLPRIAGRILGHLLVCDPPHRSGAELVQELGASKASVSAMARMLLTAGLIERAGVPGERATYYRLRSDGFEARFAAVMSSIVAFRPVADRGLALLDREEPARSARLRELRALYRFFEREMPVLFARYREERERLIEEES